MVNITNQEFGKLHKEFVDELRSKDRSESTVIAYAKDIEHCFNIFHLRVWRNSKVTISDSEFL